MLLFETGLLLKNIRYLSFWGFFSILPPSSTRLRTLVSLKICRTRFVFVYILKCLLNNMLPYLIIYKVKKDKIQLNSREGTVNSSRDAYRMK